MKFIKAPLWLTGRLNKKRKKSRLKAGLGDERPNLFGCVILTVHLFFYAPPHQRAQTQPGQHHANAGGLRHRSGDFIDT